MERFTEKPLAADLREFRDLFRKYVAAHQRPTIDACRELTVSLSLLAEKADFLQMRAAQADELEAVARDLDMVASAAASPSLQAALKAEQMQLQRELDAGGPVNVSRPGLAALAQPIGGSNVVTFPVAPQARPLGGGDAA
jgi:hypothetical protein